MTTDVLFEIRNAFGVITLNRPTALNALTKEMAAAIDRQLIEWADDDRVRVILIKGEGEKAFCAGGDIRWLHDTAKEDPVAAAEFFRTEYTMNARIHHYKKPYVAFIDGITMGGGVGLSVHGDFRVAGDRTLFAMPETGIGLFPDVGGGWFLPRLPDGIGWWYALTGARARAADALDARIATHYVPSSEHAALFEDLVALADPTKENIRDFVKERADVPDEGGLEGKRADIQRLFSRPSSLDDLYAALKADGSAFAGETLEIFAKMSPTSIAITYEHLKRGADLFFDDVMKAEFRIASRIMEGGDFFEGVRAQIIDKDRSPNWGEREEIARYFAPFEDPARELQL
ncbi:MAG: enoyl-CoA hydratase/isomerase family protein [Pseudomonadota bacterium]